MGARFLKLMEMFSVLVRHNNTLRYTSHPPLLLSQSPSPRQHIAAAARRLTENADLNIGHKKSGGAV